MSHVDFEQNTKVTMNEDKSSSSLAWYQDTSYNCRLYTLAYWKYTRNGCRIQNQVPRENHTVTSYSEI